jgi:Ser/Thr protein kinase RdoA (MazF antagonist)
VKQPWETFLMLSPDLISDRFDIGRPLDALISVPGGNTHRLYRLATTNGVWAVKVLNRSSEAWWIETFEQSVLLEDAAISAGIDCPRYVRPRDGIAGTLAEIADDETKYSVRVYEWVEGIRPSGVPDSTLAVWMASTMATLSQLDLPCKNDIETTYRSFPADEWKAWIDEALVAQLQCAPALESAIDTILDGQAFVAAGMTSSGKPQLLHRDFTPDNVLVSTRGPLLLDWDSAGPDIAWLDFIRSVWRFAGFPEREVTVDVVCSAIGTYIRKGGSVGAVNEFAFAGLANGLLNSLSYFLWRALGHRNVTTEEKAASDRLVVELLDQFQTVMRSIDSWKQLLPRSP